MKGEQILTGCQVFCYPQPYCRSGIEQDNQDSVSAVAETEISQNDDSPLIEETENSPSETEEESIEKGGPETDITPEAGSSEMGRYLTSAIRRLYANASSFKSLYGDQLSGNYKAAYDAFVSNWGDLNSTSGFDITLSSPITITISKTVNDTYKKGLSYQSEDEYKNTVKTEVKRYLYGAMDAFFYDHPEVFWCNRANFGYTGAHPYTDGTVTYKDNGDGTTDITFHAFHIYSGIELWTGASSEISIFQDAVNSAVSEISKESGMDGSDAVKSKVIGDYVAGRTAYESTDAAHTAYGALCEGKAVCDGYTKAFNLLCSKFGIKTVMGSGLVTVSSGQESHAWSYVDINGTWYMTDITFNDTGLCEEDYTLVGSNTKVGNATSTIAQLRTKYTEFSSTDYSSSFTQPVIASDAYHEYTETSRTEPTCTSTGISELTCLIHGEEKTETLPMAAHTPDKIVILKQPTCVDSGLESVRCSVCGAEIEQKTIPATGVHTYSDWEVTMKPTCTEEGVKTRTCTVCGKTETETVPATGHSASGWTLSKAETCGEDGLEVKKCLVCGEVLDQRTIPATGDHTFSDWAISKAPSCEGTGIKTRTCAVCGKTETEEIPALGHDYSIRKVISEANVFHGREETLTCSRCGKAVHLFSAKLPATAELNVSGALPMQTGQKTSQVAVSGLAEGDYVTGWASSNTKIMSVKQKGSFGVTLKAGKKAGKARVTVSLKSGLTKTFTVKVQKTKVRTSAVSAALAGRTVYLKKGQKYSVAAIVKPFTSQDKLSFSSSSSKVASVNKKGSVTAKKAGKAVITVRSGKKKTKVTVIVS